jgi:hypothetical protein
MDNCDQVEPKQCEVIQIILCDRLAAKVGVNQAESAKPAGPAAKASNVGQLEARGISQNDIANETIARHKDTDLATQFIGNCGKVFCQLRGNDLFRRDTSPEYTLERAALRLLDAECISVDLVDGEVSFLMGTTLNYTSIGVGDGIGIEAEEQNGHRRPAARQIKPCNCPRCRIFGY